MPESSKYLTTRIWRTTLNKLREIVRLRKGLLPRDGREPTIVRELDRLADEGLGRAREEAKRGDPG